MLTNNGNVLCASNAVTHTVRTVDGETFDDFVSGPLACQDETQVAPITMTRRRVLTGSQLQQDPNCGPGRFNLTQDGASTTLTNGNCRSVLAPSESPDVLRVVASQPTLCTADSVCFERGFVSLSFGFGATATQ